MADIVSPEKRSQNMSAIRSKNTKPEVYLRKLLFAQGYRYRIADKSVPGHPDIFLRKYKRSCRKRLVCKKLQSLHRLSNSIRIR